MEYMRLGTVDKLIQTAKQTEESGTLPIEQVRLFVLFFFLTRYKFFFNVETRNRLFKSLMVGLQCMLDEGLHHLDVKPDNMLLRSETEVVLTDLGTASRSATTRKGGAATFLCPELAGERAETPGEKADVWAAGISLYAMLFGAYPYARLDLDALRWLRHLDRDPRLAAAPPPARDLLRAMLALDPAQRLGIAAVLAHPWLAAPAPSPSSHPVWVCPEPHTTVFTPATVAQYRRQLEARTSRHAAHAPPLQPAPVSEGRRPSVAAPASPAPVPEPESKNRGCCTLL